MGTSLASSCTMARVQNTTENSAASEPSYEARGVGSSNLSRRTINWDEIASFAIGRPANFYLSKEDVLELFPFVQFPIPKSVYISICEHAKQLKNGLGKTTRRTQKRSINKRLNLHILWVGNNKCCYLCGTKVPFSQTTRDHVFPKSEGYSLENNTMPACTACNVAKGDVPPTLPQVRHAVALHAALGRSFAPTRGKQDSALTLLTELGVFS